MVEHVAPEATRAFAAGQWKQAKGPQPSIICECERVQPIRFMYKCWYCKMWLCDQCAPIHFDSTARCEHCGGTGFDGDEPCEFCSGAGREGGQQASSASEKQT